MTLTIETLQTISKADFLALLPEICDEGTQAFMAHKGSVLDYFLHHERGENAYNWCARKIQIPWLGNSRNFDVVAHKGTTINLPYCTSARGVEAFKGGTINLPNCKSAGRVVGHKGGTINMPNCTSAGWVVAHDDATVTLPACKSAGRVEARKNATVNLPVCTIDQQAVAFEGGTINAPLL